VLSNFVRSLTQSDLGRSCRSLVSSEYRILEDTTNQILDTIPTQEYENIRNRYLTEDPAGEEARIVHTSSRKYLNARPWLENAVERAMKLDLHKTPPKSVLDLGCGAGWFLLVARHFGHEVVGLDLAENNMYNELIQLFQLERAEHCIDPYVPLPNFNGKFDLVTGFMVYFNFYNFESKTDARAWGGEEWKYFLEDVRSHMEPKGHLHLQLNRGGPYLPERERGQYLTDETLRGLLEVDGVTVSEDRVFVTADV